MRTSSNLLSSCQLEYMATDDKRFVRSLPYLVLMSKILVTSCNVHAQQKTTQTTKCRHWIEIFSLLQEIEVIEYTENVRFRREVETSGQSNLT